MFGFGNTSFVTDLQAVQQAVQTKLKLFLGEWWEDLNEGLPFFQQIAGSNNKDSTDMLVRKRILETPNVTGISSFLSKVTSDRKYTATATISTSYGTTTVEVNS